MYACVPHVYSAHRGQKRHKIDPTNNNTGLLNTAISVQGCYLTLVIPANEGWRQENRCELEASLGYRIKPCLKTEENTTNTNKADPKGRYSLW